MSGNRPNKNNKGPSKKSIVTTFLAASVVMGGLWLAGGPTSEAPEDSSMLSQSAQGIGVPSYSVDYSEFKRKLKEGTLTDVLIQNEGPDRVITGTQENGQKFKTVAMFDPNLITDMNDAHVRYSQALSPPPEQPNPFWQLLISFGPIILIIGLFVWKMKQQQGKGGPGGVGKSKAKLLRQDEGEPVTFDDVAGIPEAKAELMETVEFLQNPQKYTRLGGKMPKGVLLLGPPGTGKTLTARAVAGEANVPFYSISGSDFVEMYVGVGASRVRDMFKEAKKNAPCIIFIDEIDAMGKARGNGTGAGGNDEREQTLNQLLVEMDGFEKDSGVVLIAATNRADVLDPALLRPGRFDRQVQVPNPDLKGREEILKVHIKKNRVPLDKNVDTHYIALGTPGFSGADIANLINEAALHAAREKKNVVDMDDFKFAKDKVMMGPERKSMIMSDEERKNTAYHEAGHALVGLNTKPMYHPLHLVSIMPRGQALGVTMNIPDKDIFSQSENQLKAQMAVMFGGRAAEEKLNGKENITTGASNDIERATQLAINMVTKCGFSHLGPRHFDGNGGAFGTAKNFSEATANKIDAAVDNLIEEGVNTAKGILDKNSDALTIIAEGLLKYETLSGDEVDILLKGGKLTDREEVIHNIAGENEKGSSSSPAPEKTPEANDNKAPDLDDSGFQPQKRNSNFDMK